jgi:hypothetical protein
MAIFKIYPSKDATIYSLYPSMNAGRDEIIEASTTVTSDFSTNLQTSRILIAFSDDEINDIINNKISGSNWDVNLRLFASTITGLKSDSFIYIHPISGSWNMGTGKYLDSPQTTDGVSWEWRDYSGSMRWSTGSYNPNVTASFSNVPGGGTYYSASSLPGYNFPTTQSFSFYDDKDINVSVKDIIELWYSGSFDNNGFLLHQNNEFVDNVNQQVQLKYFSIDTNTIYPPQLEFKWVDYVYNTGSSTNTTISTDQLYVKLTNNRGTYYSGSIQRFRVDCRPKYPTRVFQTSSIYTTNYFLPQASYYAIKDLDTNEFIVDFDSLYTQVSADSDGNYFDVYMNGLEPERYYQILIKTTISGSTLIIKDDNFFKVVNG